ncbi:MAG TPA: aldehyde dehydrogenase family protein [Patescibacteria group bacterium]|nr:aldehyde dehydrogenase family protein [Patescibacteria group bacterium]
MANIFDDIKEGDEYKFFSGGKWIKSKSERTIDIMSPIDGTLIGKIQAVLPEEIDEMLSNAEIAQKKWANYSTEDRAALIKKAAEIMLENKEEIADMKVLEVGKTKKAAISSVIRSAGIVSYTADQIAVVNDSEIFYSKNFPGADDKKTSTFMHEPIGVVLAISPFNYPVNLLVTKLAPALLAGNAVIMKGPTQGTICTAMVAQVFHKAGFPEGVVNFVSGKGSEIGDYLVSHKKIGMISFTGSSDVGKNLVTKAGLKPLILELGGKDAALVLSDADMDIAVAQVADGAFSYAGQRCTAIKRVFILPDIHDEFTKKLIEVVKEKYDKVGDPRKEETQMGPIISEKQTDYVQELVFDAVESGAKIIHGGMRKANYMDATIIDGVNKDMRIAWEEQFGPVLPIIICESVEEMIELHNQSQYGLGGSIFTSDLAKAKEIAERLQTGVIQINAKSERYPDNFPFLGIKESGLGIQGIRWSIQAMMRDKSIVDNKL